MAIKKIELGKDGEPIITADSAASTMRQLGIFEESKIDKAVEKEPDILGSKGKAWKIDIQETLRRQKIDERDDASVSMWIVEAPWAHPVWHSYAIFCVHLRPMHDNRKASIYKDGATHEILVYAMAPDCDREEVISKGSPMGSCLLHPVNYGGQFIEITDDLARARVWNTVDEIVNGLLSPDTDFLQQWVRRFGGDMLKK